MSELATIFEKIKENFFENQIKVKDREKYKLIFSPFSTGFTYDDFLFLDSNSALENAHKYIDELLEFSQIANTIPRENNFWAVSDHQDYLFHPYKNILNGLRLMDIETLNVEMFYGHPIFEKALSSMGKESVHKYRCFFDEWSKQISEIENLKKTLTNANRTTVDIQVRMKEEKLDQIKTEWVSDGNKEEIETKIIDIIRDEFKRFLNRFIEAKGQLETLVRTHPGSGVDFYLTSCMPNNLYKGSDIKWKIITLEKPEIESLVKKIDHEDYEDILGSSELSKLEVESISFELLFANVTRAWFDETILKSPFWDINILNREDIDIPRITSKLIFVRNVELKTQKTSKQNEILLKKEIINNVGPFIVNAQGLKKKGSFKLHSVNKSLNIDRHTVLDVGSKLRRKVEVGHTKYMVGKKQQQFLKLAPRLKSSQSRKLTIRSRPKSSAYLRTEASRTSRVAPKVRTSSMNKNIKCRFYFKDMSDGSPVPIKNNEVYFAFQNKEVPVLGSNDQEENHIFNISLKAGNIYKLSVETKGYKQLDFTFSIPQKNANNAFQKTISLERIIDIPEQMEAFQLIGVISKEITSFPNPIKKAHYM